jgi:hypothetical protein
MRFSAQPMRRLPLQVALQASGWLLSLPKKKTYAYTPPSGRTNLPHQLNRQKWEGQPPYIDPPILLHEKPARSLPRAKAAYA